ncbi:hypothetical protein FOCC_FOCC007459 [Frankliniella occidentalis]|nr:hypothetical protein FOCC_FOCC007459 [Frankliniella occidentalis]
MIIKEKGSNQSDHLKLIAVKVYFFLLKEDQHAVCEIPHWNLDKSFVHEEDFFSCSLQGFGRENTPSGQYNFICWILRL